MARILVLEDDKYCIGTLFEVLTEVSDHEFRIFERVEGALREFKKTEFDLVICDLFIQRSTLQGEDFLEWIRSRGDATPVLLLTGMEYVAVLKKRGHYYYNGHRIAKQVKKPIEAHELLKHIDSVIGE